MTSCKNRQFLPPPPLRHYCLELDLPSEQKMTSSLLTPLRTFSIFYAYNDIYISVGPSFNYLSMRWIRK